MQYFPVLILFYVLSLFVCLCPVSPIPEYKVILMTLVICTTYRRTRTGDQLNSSPPPTQDDTT
jgi:hypothetical protein